MSIVWDKEKQAAGFMFTFGGWVYQLHHSHVACSPGNVLCIGRYR